MNSEMPLNTSRHIQIILATFLFLIISVNSFAQTLFNENFTGADGLTSGNSMGIPWTAICSTCGPGYFETRNGKLELSASSQAVSFTSGPIDITNCSQLIFTMEYIGQPYSGAGNFEMPTEVMGTCAGDPYDPNAGDCDGLWDFFLAEIALSSGGRERAEFIGNGNFSSASNVNFTSACTGSATTAVIEIKANASASGEVMTFDNIMLVCFTDDAAVKPITSSVVYCNGETVNMRIPPVSGASYQWFDTDGNLIGSNSPNLSFSANASLSNASDQQTISYVLTQSDGCKVTDDLNILVFDGPSLTLSAPSLTYCEGDDVTISASTPDVVTFNWEGQSSPVPGIGQEGWSIPDIMLSEAGNYSVTVTNGSGCTASEDIVISVSSTDSYSLPEYGVVCSSSDPFPLDTKFGDITGNWLDNNGVMNNVFDPSSVTPGFITITFEPDNTGCVASQIAPFTVSAGPETFPASIEECGSGQVLFDLREVEETVNGGSGLAVSWFADMALTTPIASNHSSSTATVYAVVTDALGCQSAPQAVELMVVDGAEINMPDTLLACVSLMLPAISITNGSGNERYYNEPGGMGTSYLPGEIFTLMDTVLYIYDISGTCEVEHEITLLIGTPRNAGINLAFDTCAIGVIDLFSIKDPQANTGFFINVAGDTIEDGLLNTSGLEGIDVDLVYSIPADRGCAVDQAQYSLFFEPFLSAGKDSSVSICLGESLDISTMTEDGGSSGEFYLIGATNTVSTNIVTEVTDLPFDRTYLYITDSGNSCPLDTAFLTVRGVSNDTTFISGNFCSDYEEMVLGTSYNINNPTGIEIDPAGGRCGGVISINLEFRPINEVTIDRVLCEDQFILVNGVRYDETNLSGTEIIENGDQFGCDSIINVALTFDDEITFLIEETYCSTREIDINGTTYNINNPKGSSTLQSVSGCDSIVMVDLSFEQAIGVNIDGVYCPDDTINIGNQVFDINNPFGLVELPNSNPMLCDTVVTVTMEFDMNLTRTFNNSLCVSEQIVVNGTNYGAANPSGTEIISNPVGCDSLYVIELQILQSDTIYIEEIFCKDTSIMVNGITYDVDHPLGEEIIIGGSTNGCDQHVFVDLSFGNSTELNITEDLCNGDFITVNNVIYDENNPTGQEVFPNMEGCDSIVNIDLSFEGLTVNFEVKNPFCMAEGEGYLVVQILEGLNWVVDVILDGESVFDQILISDTIYNVPLGSHDLEILNGVGCTFKEDFEIEIQEDYDFSISSTESSQGYQLGIMYDGELESILWLPSETLSCNTCPNPIATPDEKTTYEVLAEDVSGCVFSDSITLDYLFIDEYFRANVFSPNEDGVNDVFFIDSMENIPFTTFQIFDRWGNKVFVVMNGTTGDLIYGWDGNHGTTKAQQGVYFYYMTLDLPSGQQTIMGDISLIR